MCMCFELIRKLYQQSVDQGMGPAPPLDYMLNGAEVHSEVPVDYAEEYLYKDLFDEACREALDHVYAELIFQLKKRTKDDISDLISALSFVQLVAARAMWKYNLQISSAMENFARDFERLDVDSECERLYYLAQRSSI